MKLKIWNEEEAKIADENQIFLRLEKIYDGDIALLSVDKNNNPIGKLLYLDQDLNVIILASCVIDLPLKTDLYGHLLVYTNKEFDEFKNFGMKHIMANELKKSLHQKEKDESEIH